MGYNFTEVKPRPTKIEQVCNTCGLVKKIASNRKKCNACRQLTVDINQGRVLDRTFTDVTYKNYKEPLREVEGGYGYYGTVALSKTGSHIQCHKCGYWFTNLSAHVYNRHVKSEKLFKSLKDYRTNYGLRLTEGLVSPQERERLQNQYNRTIREQASKNLEKAWKVAKEKRDSGELKTGGDQWTLQTRNEKGLCPDQMLYKINALADRLKRPPTIKEFVKEYGESHEDVIYTLFGSWNRAMDMSGLGSFSKRKAVDREQRREEAIGAMLEFYEKHERTPQSSDFSDGNGLPPIRVVIYLFGSLNSARKLAGLPILINVGGKWVESLDY